MAPASTRYVLYARGRTNLLSSPLSLPTAPPSLTPASAEPSTSSPLGPESSERSILTTATRLTNYEDLPDSAITPPSSPRPGASLPHPPTLSNHDVEPPPGNPRLRASTTSLYRTSRDLTSIPRGTHRSNPSSPSPSPSRPTTTPPPSDENRDPIQPPPPFLDDNDDDDNMGHWAPPTAAPPPPPASPSPHTPKTEGDAGASTSRDRRLDQSRDHDADADADHTLPIIDRDVVARRVADLLHQATAEGALTEVAALRHALSDAVGATLAAEAALDLGPGGFGAELARLRSKQGDSRIATTETTGITPREDTALREAGQLRGALRAAQSQVTWLRSQLDDALASREDADRRHREHLETTKVAAAEEARASAQALEALWGEVEAMRDRVAVAEATGQRDLRRATEAEARAATAEAKREDAVHERDAALTQATRWEKELTAARLQTAAAEARVAEAEAMASAAVERLRRHVATHAGTQKHAEDVARAQRDAAIHAGGTFSSGAGAGANPTTATTVMASDSYLAEQTVRAARLAREAVRARALARAAGQSRLSNALARAPATLRWLGLAHRVLVVPAPLLAGLETATWAETAAAALQMDLVASGYSSLVEYHPPEATPEDAPLVAGSHMVLLVCSGTGTGTAGSGTSPASSSARWARTVVKEAAALGVPLLVAYADGLTERALLRALGDERGYEHGDGDEVRESNSFRKETNLYLEIGTNAWLTDAWEARAVCLGEARMLPPSPSSRTTTTSGGAGVVALPPTLSDSVARLLGVPDAMLSCFAPELLQAMGAAARGLGPAALDMRSMRPHGESPQGRSLKLTVPESLVVGSQDRQRVHRFRRALQHLLGASPYLLAITLSNVRLLLPASASIAQGGATGSSSSSSGSGGTHGKDAGVVGVAAPSPQSSHGSSSQLIKTLGLVLLEAATRPGAALAYASFNIRLPLRALALGTLTKLSLKVSHLGGASPVTAADLILLTQALRYGTRRVDQDTEDESEREESDPKNEPLVQLRILDVAVEAGVADSFGEAVWRSLVAACRRPCRLRGGTVEASDNTEEAVVVGPRVGRLNGVPLDTAAFAASLGWEKEEDHDHDHNRPLTLAVGHPHWGQAGTYAVATLLTEGLDLNLSLVPLPWHPHLNHTRGWRIAVRDAGCGHLGAAALVEAFGEWLPRVNPPPTHLSLHGVPLRHVRAPPALASLLLGGRRDQGLEATPCIAPCWREVDLTGTALGDDGLAAISRVLSQLTQMRTLRLAHNGLTVDGIRSVVSSTSTSTVRAYTLEVLDLSGNSLGDAGCTALAAWLRAWRCAVRLDLSDNYRIGRAGILAFTDLASLPCEKGEGDEAGIVGTTDKEQSIPSITALDVSRNHLGPDGARAIARLLSTSMTLTWLRLDKCKLRGEGCVTIVNSLVHNDALESLLLTRNHVGDRDVAAMPSALRVNTRLGYLDIRGNAFGLEGVRALEKGVRGRGLELVVEVADVGDRRLPANVSVGVR